MSEQQIVVGYRKFVTFEFARLQREELYRFRCLCFERAKYRLLAYLHCIEVSYFYGVFFAIYILSHSSIYLRGQLAFSTMMM